VKYILMLVKRISKIQTPNLIAKTNEKFEIAIDGELTGDAVDNPIIHQNILPEITKSSEQKIPKI
jgi:hypothetical protein